MWYQCKKCGCRDDAAGPCWNCGGIMEFYELGSLPNTVGFPNFTSDELHGNNFDFSAGRSFTSRAERKKHYKEHGLSRMSASEFRRKNNTEEHHPLSVITYGGQKHRQSSAERLKDI